MCKFRKAKYAAVFGIGECYLPTCRRCLPPFHYNAYLYLCSRWVDPIKFRMTAIRKGGHMSSSFILVVFFVAWAIGGLYFAFADSTVSLARRIVCSAHGPCITLVFMIVVSLTQGRASEKYTELFLWIQMFPCVLIIYSLVRYPGPRSVHLLLLLLIPCWLLLVALGYLVIHGE